MGTQEIANKKLLLVYDRECPACRNYVQTIRIRETVGDLLLINARDDSEVVRQLTALGFDLDQGMALKIDEQIYYGGESIHMLALMGSRSGIFNKFNYWIFKSRTRSKFLYPVMRTGRNLLLKILRKEKINNLNIIGNHK